MRPDALPRIVAGLALCLASTTALAAPPKKDLGKDMADEAAVLFQQKEFLRAAELFERAFALNPEKLVRLRNAGRAFEEAGRLEHAKHLFERYLELAPPGPERDDVAVRLQKIDLRLAEAAAPPPAPTPTTAPAATVQQPDARSNTLAWGIVGGGTAVVAAGVVWLVQVMGAEGKIDDHEAAGHYQYAGGKDKLAADRDTLGTNKLGAYGSLGLGTVAAAAGLWLAVRPDPPAQARLLPAIAPQPLGAVAVWRF